MSVVTNVILSGSGGCRPEHRTVVDALDAFLQSDDEPRPQDKLVRVDQHGGGTWAMEKYLWIGAFNGLDVPGFVRAYQKAVQDLHQLHLRPQLLLCRQDDDKFYEVPHEDDGTQYHYCSVEQDTHPK